MPIHFSIIEKYKNIRAAILQAFKNVKYIIRYAIRITDQTKESTKCHTNNFLDASGQLLVCKPQMDHIIPLRLS